MKAPSRRYNTRKILSQHLYGYLLVKKTITQFIADILESSIEYSLDIDQEFLTKLVNFIFNNLEEIESYITTNSNYNITNLSFVERSILLIAICELLFFKETPKKVVLNEAINLAKEFGGPTSYKFINGTLDKISKQID